MNKFLEFKSHLGQALIKDLLFACFSFPGSRKLHFISQSSSKIISSNNLDLTKKLGFIIHPFEKNDEAIWIQGDIYFHELSDSIPLAKSINYDRGFQSQINPKSDKADYIKELNELINSIKNKKADKVVLSRNQKIEISRNDLIEPFIALNEEHTDAFVFLVNLPGNISWLGASPETLLIEDHGLCKTMALAATRPSSEIDFEWNKKEIEEHAYVSNYIEKVLVDSNINYKKSDLQEKILNSGLKHLCQIFQFKLPESTSIWNIVYNLHPTPAICGIPVKNSMDLIKKVENYKREFYTGFLGSVNLEDKTSLFVNLRSAQITKKDACLYVGGGITADSSPISEWNETELKTKTILKALKNDFY